MCVPTSIGVPHDGNPPFCIGNAGLVHAVSFSNITLSDGPTKKEPHAAREASFAATGVGHPSEGCYHLNEPAEPLVPLRGFLSRRIRRKYRSETDGSFRGNLLTSRRGFGTPTCLLSFDANKSAERTLIRQICSGLWTLGSCGVRR